MMTLKPDFITTGSWIEKYFEVNFSFKIKVTKWSRAFGLKFKSRQINLVKTFDTFYLLQEGIVFLIEFSSKKKCK